ncbi:dolichol-phosphate mannosyltransferase [Mycobacterium sp. IS-1742]|uniref:glycosyltransferase n=1 Tax=Mycobacterium sp. IS-1742 TaxID=1772285 RepID=UPI000740457D|nr:glycosyltransferase [Mycobacterium sp. IS-1742]KUI23816.1 dolichol-phosphate mannosyltransferase [Mycobacterium sp. IS-1742]
MTDTLVRDHVDTAVRLGQVHIVLPAYNEEGSLRPLLERIDRLAASQPLTVWVIDDGSADDTATVAASGPAGLDVKVVTHEVNLGLGQAIQTGLRSVLAVASDDDVLVVMDADDTHDPMLVGALVREIDNGADIAICSRFTDGGDDTTAPPLRRVMSRGAAHMFRVVAKVDGVRDFTSGYRAYRVSLLRRAAGHWGERLVVEQGFACMVELLLKLRHCNPRIAEVPLVLQYDRKQGASKLKLARTLKQYFKLLVRESFTPAPYRQV